VRRPAEERKRSPAVEQPRTEQPTPARLPPARREAATPPADAHAASPLDLIDQLLAEKAPPAAKLPEPARQQRTAPSPMELKQPVMVPPVVVQPPPAAVVAVADNIYADENFAVEDWDADSDIELE